MQYQLFFIPFYAIYTLSTHIDRNNSDVIITYTGHNEADRVMKDKTIKEPIINQGDVEIPHTENFTNTEANEVVFIPNEKEVFRNEDYRDVKVHDLIENTNVRNIMKTEHKTENPVGDIIFISGKNHENVESNVRPKEAERIPTGKKMKMDCNNLNCNNTLASICGLKEEDNKIKYRLFLNECFFRKVNCAFKYANNRYKVVPIEHCKNIGGRVIPKPYAHKPNVVKKGDTRRSFSSRRTLNMGIDGAFCGHSCPDHCTEDYEPQCAVSANGERRVFVNHCVLDYNSCLYGAVWQRRPLSECVGGKKADLRQNRGFIGWLQRVGIVDKRGRLVLS
ncbi:uncharacterized protein LOC123715142 isoform X2 [Pieris brassicae]|nr:uncharacterized protein LOC123715142 isoform X2 [Pieris brassicae]